MPLKKSLKDCSILVQNLPKQGLEYGVNRPTIPFFLGVEIVLQNLLLPFQNKSKAKIPVDLTYQPDVLTCVTHTNWLGQADIQVKIYLPGLYLDCATDTSETATAKIQVKPGNSPWQSMLPWKQNPNYWVTELRNIFAGTPLRFRFCDAEGLWQPIAPLTALERVYETTYVPNLQHHWQHQPPRFDHGRVIMETTLEGLLAGYNKVLAPRNREEMFRNPVALNIVRTDLPGALSEWGIDELMVTSTSSMADRAHLDPGFNYLTYDVADVDWQVGRTKDFLQLIDELYQYGLSLIPDLSIPHHVFKPFKGSLDQIQRQDNGELIYVDEEAQQFRNHGTWMFKLSDAEIRKQIVAKVIYFVQCFHLRTIRLSYLDGLMLQYSQREPNYGAILLTELRTALKHYAPDLLIMGEATETAHYPAVEECIDIACTPTGFPMVEELYKPPHQCDRPLFPSIEPIVQHILKTTASQSREAGYAQLHDEICSNEYTATARGNVPWAYGQNPAQLAKVKGDTLVEAGLLPRQELLNYVRRTVRAIEALTMFSSRLMYMFVPAVDALSLGCLNTSDNWKVQWEGLTSEQLATWSSTGLSERQTFLLHDQHRSDMVALRKIFRCHTPVISGKVLPLVQVHICHVDPTNAVIGLLRTDPTRSEHTLLILFNLGDNSFLGSPNSYELPPPLQLKGQWTVVFNGDWLAPQRCTDEQPATGYAPGTFVEPGKGEFFTALDVLTLKVGARSLLVLKHVAYSE